MKRFCSECEKEKEVKCFYKNLTICRECRNTYRRLWRKKNPGRDAVTAKRYRRNNPEKVRASREKYVKNNPDIIRRAQMTRDKNKHADIKRRRRRKKLAAEGAFTQKEFLELCAIFKNKCLRCGGSFDIGGQYGLVADHIIPLSKGGSDYIFNIQCLCGTCNRKKHIKIIDYRTFIPSFVKEKIDEVSYVKRAGSSR